MVELSLEKALPIELTTIFSIDDIGNDINKRCLI